MPSSLITGLLPKKARKGLINSQGDANKKASRKQKETLAAVSLRRSRICDVRGGPLPPRGSVTQDKLAYLDWRLGYIRDARICSEKTDLNWADGRDTIGRTSFEIVHCIQDSNSSDGESSGHASDSISSVSNGNPGETGRPEATYAMKKVEAEKALKQAIMADAALASVPLLARDAAHGDLERSSSSDESGGEQEAEANSDRQRQLKRPGSLFHRASFRLNSSSMAKTAKSESTKSSQPDLTKANAVRGRIRPISRLWQH